MRPFADAAAAPLPDWAAWFQGDWQLSRQVTDRRAGTVLHFEGRLAVTVENSRLRLDETGRWTDAPWGALAGHRVYLWVPEGRGRVQVLYGDGRPFHAFTPVQQGRATARHLCDPDTYDVTYVFDLPACWQHRWDVTGPAKDYTMLTRLTRPVSA